MLLGKRCVCDSFHVTSGHLAICKRTLRSYYRQNLLRNLVHDFGAMALNVNFLSIVVESPIVTPTQSLRIDLKIVINDGTYVLTDRGRDQPSSALIHEYFDLDRPFATVTSYEKQKLLNHGKVMRDSDPDDAIHPLYLSPMALSHPECGALCITWLRSLPL